MILMRFLSPGTVRAVFVCLFGCAAGGDRLAPGDDRVVQVSRPFDGEPVGPLASIVHHTWSAEQKAAAGEYSQFAIVDDGGSGSRCARMRVSDRLPGGDRAEHRLLTIGPDYLPPEADAVRMRVRVTDG